MPPLSEGGPQVTVTLYGPMEGKSRSSGLPGGAVEGGGGGDNVHGVIQSKELTMYGNKACHLTGHTDC